MPPPSAIGKGGHDCGAEYGLLRHQHSYQGGGKLEGLRALITGGDSGIGRPSRSFSLRADLAIAYYNEKEDARDAVYLAQAALPQLGPGDVKAAIHNFTRSRSASATAHPRELRGAGTSLDAADRG